MMLSFKASKLSGNGLFPDEFHINKPFKLITIRRKQMFGHKDIEIRFADIHSIETDRHKVFTDIVIVTKNQMRYVSPGYSDSDASRAFNYITKELKRMQQQAMASDETGYIYNNVLCIKNDVQKVPDDAYNGKWSGLYDTVSIHPKTKTIGERAFMNSHSLKFLTTEAGDSPKLKSIGNEAFKGCDNLKTINLPSTVEVIGECAFQNCRLLDQVVIPWNIEKIDSLAFDGCKNLKILFLPQFSRGIEIAEDAFLDCDKLEHVFWFTEDGNGLENVDWPIIKDSRILHVSRSVWDDIAMKYMMMGFSHIVGDIDSNAEEHVRQFNYPV